MTSLRYSICMMESTLASTKRTCKLNTNSQEPLSCEVRVQTTEPSGYGLVSFPDYTEIKIIYHIEIISETQYAIIK